MFLLKSNKNFPIQYPCKKGDAGTCKKQVARKGERRTAGFGCFFYDSLVVETAGSGEDTLGTVRIGLPLPEDHADAGACRIKVTVDGKACQDLALGDFERPEVARPYVEWAAEVDADGDTLNDDPYEIDDTRMASLSQSPAGNFA